MKGLAAMVAIREEVPGARIITPMTYVGRAGFHVESGTVLTRLRMQEAAATLFMSGGVSRLLNL
jgi:hypothetical protein